MELDVAIRRLTETDRREAAQVYVAGLGEEEVRPLMPRHMDRAERIFAELIKPDNCSWVAESDRGCVIGLALCREPGAVASSMKDWSVYRRYLPPLAALRARFVARYLYDVSVAHDTVYLQSLVVSQEWQGRGVGTALVDFVCRIASQRGYSRIQLNVVEGNDRARRLYDHLGFSRLQTVPAGVYRYLVGWPSLDSLEKELE